jgi:N-acetylglucosamine-6-sulfatase
VLLLGAALALLVSSVARAPASRDAGPVPHAATTSLPAKARHGRPNIVFILTDDLSWNLVNRRFTPHIVALEKRGETFDHYFVTDSLCCPSRATIFTGLFPHDTHVTTNSPPAGGFFAFQRHHLARRTYAVALHRGGYATSMMGKYLNRYGDPIRLARVPPGWTDWHVANSSGYKEFDYVQDDNGREDRYGGPRGGCEPGGPAADIAVAGQRSDDYGVDVLSRDATAFIGRAARRPFAMEVATFAPHRPYTPSPRNACDFPGLTAPRDPSFDANNVSPPSWLGQRPPLSARALGIIEDGFRRRAQSMEAVDALVARVERKLRAAHLLRRTYIVFSSDNGYHMGQHRLWPGKMTAFDSDIRVPLIVAGPGVPHGRIVHEVAQNTDLAPTFEQLAGETPPASVDGHSLVPLLHPAGHASVHWRTLALVEHRGRPKRTDPDYEAGKRGGDPTTYRALRISSPHVPGFAGPVEAVYVEYRDGEHEYYDIARDPFEQRNVVGRLRAAQLRELHRLLRRLKHCHGTSACWRAAAPAARPAPRRASPGSLRFLARAGA